MDIDIGSVLTRILPLLDYYITFFTKVLTSFAASLGIDLGLPGEDAPEATPEEVQ